MEKNTEQTKKNLRIISLCLVIFSIVSLALAAMDLITFWMDRDNYSGTSDGVVLASIRIVGVMSLLMVAVQIYIGLKGMKVAKEPDSSKGHITWATVFLVLSIIALVSPVMEMIQTKAIVANVVTIIDCLVDVLLYYYFIKWAKEVRVVD